MLKDTGQPLKGDVFLCSPPKFEPQFGRVVRFPTSEPLSLLSLGARQKPHLLLFGFIFYEKCGVSRDAGVIELYKMGSAFTRWWFCFFFLSLLHYRPNASGRQA